MISFLPVNKNLFTRLLIEPSLTLKKTFLFSDLNQKIKNTFQSQRKPSIPAAWLT